MDGWHVGLNSFDIYNSISMSIFILFYFYWSLLEFVSV